MCICRDTDFLQINLLEIILPRPTGKLFQFRQRFPPKVFLYYRSASLSKPRVTRTIGPRLAMGRQSGALDYKRLATYPAYYEAVEPIVLDTEVNVALAFVPRA